MTDATPHQAAAKRAFADFLDDRKNSKNQIEFINPIIYHPTQHGVVRHLKHQRSHRPDADHSGTRT